MLKKTTLQFQIDLLAAWLPVDEPTLVSIMTHDHAKNSCSSELEYVICRMHPRMYARACCTCNRAVRTDNMILKGSVQPFTHHSSLLSKLINNYCHRILHDQPGHLLPDHQHPVNQPARLLGQDNMITVVPRLPGQSSSTPVAPRTCTKQPGGSHAVYMWLQSRLVRERRDRSTLDLEINFFSSLTIL